MATSDQPTTSTGSLEPSRTPLQKNHKNQISQNTPKMIEISEPLIGTEFSDDEKAYQFYNGYARRVGFSVRKQNMSRGKNGIIRARRFVCSREGYYKPDSSDKNGQYSRSNVRTGCQAHIGIKRLKSGFYCIHRFVPDHNHPLVSSKKVHLLRSQREYSNNHNVNDDNERGILCKETVPIIGTAAVNSCTSRLNGLRQFEMKPGDVVSMVHYLQNRGVKELGFSFSMQMDSKDQIANIFWCDAKSKMDYRYFGDVVCFDSTYKLNGYDRPLVQFFGTNHHKQIVVFGTGFLYNDSLESFKWLFQIFKDSMAGNRTSTVPGLVLTDKNENIEKAVREIWPDMVQRVCAWTMHQCTMKNLSQIFQSYPGFEIELKKCFFDCENEDEFVSTWQNLVQNFGLSDNAWLKSLFEERENWCLVCRKDLFYADIYSSLKKENMSGIIKASLHNERDIFSFFNRYERILKDKRYGELEADLNCAGTQNMVPVSRLLKQANLIYTPQVYEMIVKEFELYVDCVIESCGTDGTNYVYEVKNVEKKITGYVQYDQTGDMLSCTCKKFESVGILCSHCLKVLDYKNIKEIPEKYVLKRWRKDAKSARAFLQFYDDSDEPDPTVAMESRFVSLSRVFEQIINKGSSCQEAHNVAVEEANKIMDKMEGVIAKFANKGRHESLYSESSDGESRERNRVRKRRKKKLPKENEEGITGIKKKDKESNKKDHCQQNISVDKGKEVQGEDPTTRIESHLEDSTNNYNPWSSVGYLSLQFPTINQDAFVTGSTQQPFCITTTQPNHNGSSPFILNPHPPVTNTFPPELSDRQVI